MKLKDQRGITTFWGISIILMEVVVVIFVFYILYYFWIENPVPTSEITLIRAVRHQAVSIPHDVAQTDWLTYENPTYAVSFRYPDTYTLSEDDIYYDTNAGHLITLREGTAERFSLRIFAAGTDESITDTLKRLTHIDPSIYQSFNEKVGGQAATIYRQKPGTADNDQIYFLHHGYLFQAPFNAVTVDVLSTFTLL